jgi:hypothetical protein
MATVAEKLQALAGQLDQAAEGIVISIYGDSVASLSIPRRTICGADRDLAVVNARTFADMLENERRNERGDPLPEDPARRFLNPTKRQYKRKP